MVFSLLQRHSTSCLLMLSGVLASSGMALAQSDWSAVGAALGKPGVVHPDGIYKVTLPRDDLTLSLDGVPLHASFLRGTWLSFERHGQSVSVVADLALTETEVKPVMEKLEESGFDITGLHNHMMRVVPMMMFLHAMGHGDAVTLARGLHEALILTKTPLSSAPRSQQPPDANEAELDRLLGAPSKIRDGVIQYRIRRRDTITESGMPIPQTMGMEAGINIQPIGGGKAVITGDLPIIESEVQPVLHAMRAEGFEITALHNHMISEQPRVFFLHFWANADAAQLARGAHNALEKTQIDIHR